MYVYKRASSQTAVYVYDCMRGCLKTNTRFTSVRRPNRYETREPFAWTALKNREENVPPPPKLLTITKRKMAGMSRMRSVNNPHGTQRTFATSIPLSVWMRHK